ncbi:MAG: ATP-binding protein [Gemmatimonadales bacterium]
MPGPPARSIRNQLILLVGAVAVPLTGLAAFNIYLDFRTGIEVAQARAEGVAAATASSVRQFLSNARQILETLAADPRIASPDPAVCRMAIDPAASSLPQFQPIVVADTGGRLVCSGVETGVSSIADRRWFRDALTTGVFTVGDPIVGRITQRPVVVMSGLVRDSAGTPIRVVGIVASSEALLRLITADSVSGEALITLADLDGLVVARTEEPEVWFGKTLPRIPEAGVGLRTAAGGVSRGVDIEGTERIFSWRRVGDSRWVVFVGIPAALALRSAHAALAGKLGLGLAIALLTLGLARGFHTRITRALGAVIDQMRSASEGAPRPIPEGGPAEIAAVARQFNQTLAARRSAEEALTRASERYRSIVQNAVLGIYVTSADGTIVEANRALATLLGQASPKELAGTNERAFYADPSDWEREVQRALEQGLTAEAEVQWLRPDGKPLAVRILRSAFQDGDGNTALEVIAEDLTERRDLEEQTRRSQKMEAVGRLAGGVAHDFNNRLTVVLAYGELLLEEIDPDDPLHEHVEEIVHAAKGAKSLTAQLLAFSRREVVQARQVDLNAIVGRFAAMLPNVLGAVLTIRTELGDGLPPIHADPGQVEQMLLNLALNARDAMPDGGTLTVRTVARTVHQAEARANPELAPGGYIALQVIDTGVGMSEAVRSRVFEPFFTTKPLGEGTGLGLAMVYGLVKQHGGYVMIESAPGKGTTVEILLPTAAQPVAANQASESRTTSQAGATVLVAEDDDDVRRVVVRILERGGHSVLTARDGVTALEQLDRHRGEIDLLLTDILMPGMRGIALADRVQAALPGTPVLFVSGYSSDPPPLDSSGGPRGFVRKPVEIEVLLAAVADMLARASRLREPG